MKQTIYLLPLTLFMLVNCTSNDNSASKDTTANNSTQGVADITFETYIKTLDKISLPLAHNPLGQLPELSKNYNRIGFEKYKHTWTSQPLGVLYNDDKMVTLVDCSIGDWGLVPFFTTYDRQGNKIDSLGPYKKSGEDIAYKAIEYMTINKDRTIIVIDTVITYSLNSDSSDIDQNTKKITTGSTTYTIDASGHFQQSE